MAATAFSAAIIDILRRVSTDALAMCGASTTFSSFSSSGWTRGSYSYTSMPAPAITRCSNASVRCVSGWLRVVAIW